MPSRDFFIFSAEFLPLGASASATVRISIQADSHFELIELTGDVKTADTVETVVADPSITLLILDEGSGRQLFDRAQIWSNLIGTAQRPFILPQPKTFRANSTIAITATELSGNARRVRISLIGYKLFAEAAGGAVSA